MEEEEEKERVRRGGDEVLWRNSGRIAWGGGEIRERK